MRIDLGALLEQHDYREELGAAAIAKGADIDRRTVTKFLNGTASRIAMLDLSRLCEWLVTKDVNSTELPGALFHQNWFWSAISGKPVTFHLGEKRQREGPSFTKRWVALDDVMVVNEVTTAVARATSPRRTIASAYVPLHVSDGSDDSQRPVDRAMAKRMYNQVAQHRGVNIMVGSPRANLLTELLVADLFSRTPFRAPQTMKRGLPFFLRFPSRGDSIESCCGGSGGPSWVASSEPGIYYYYEKHWQHALWTSETADAAIILTRQRRDRSRTDVAFAGLTGRSTRCASRLFIDNPSMFKPDCEGPNECLYGVSLCVLEFNPMRSREFDDADAVMARPIKLVP